MNKLLRTLVLGTVCGGSLLLATPEPARADRYWRNHWSWYDNTYRPYYQRRYYGSPYYRGYYYNPPSAYYGSPYYGNPYYGNHYYYGPPSGGGVQIGPLQFGWW
ncbi:MAG: hypothetical protein ACT4QC_06040 [Planctomycetaceae bacterium]